MTGKKGRSGGARPGAGAPTTKMVLHDGETIIVMQPTVCTATVQVLNASTVVLKLDDGSEIKITR